MKNSVRIAITASALAAFACIFAIICGMTARSRSLMTCDGIRLIYADDYRFVTEEDIKGWLDAEYGAYIGQRLDSIRLHKVENVLNVQSAILNSEAFTTDDGKLNIRLTQREPVVRFQKDGYGFYADVNGFIFPLQENYISMVPVVDGNVPVTAEEGYKGALKDEKEREWMKGVISMVNYMNRSKVWAENIVQINVDEKGDIVMIPREGNERFIFGSPFDAENKFSRIERYYRYILPEKGEGYYRTVNVKFNKQIVCKK